MVDFKSSKTYQNLWLALVNETLGRVKYEFYCDQAEKENNARAALIFDTTSNNELEHAQVWFKLLHGNDIPSTASNLEEAIGGEVHEHEVFYREMAAEAEEEGFSHIAFLFNEVADIEGEHAARFEELLTQPEIGQVDTIWRCTKCGHEWTGENAPMVCPVCGHPQSYAVKENFYV